VTAAALLAQKEELRRQLSLSQETVKTLTDSLAESNAESGVVSAEFADLQCGWKGSGWLRPARTARNWSNDC